ncbi:hypothetical protein L2E82_13772 [Cichorium intybus]|uniref:Uncharacterized protein n=1 Tax=Cichorium intybus TaxID=13427 RepID=A0ACB9EYS4_CICIN|nr:hypothetical protein L2E82_13772 [Cichorium intybus]
MKYPYRTRDLVHTQIYRARFEALGRESVLTARCKPIGDESSSHVGNQYVSSLLEDDSNLWEELLNIEKNPEDVLEDLDTQQLDWDDDLKELMDQIEYLRSSNP